MRPVWSHGRVATWTGDVEVGVMTLVLLQRLLRLSLSGLPVRMGRPDGAWASVLSGRSALSIPSSHARIKPTTAVVNGRLDAWRR